MARLIHNRPFGCAVIAAAVACPARNECPAYWAASSPARCANFLTMRATSTGKPAGPQLAMSIDGKKKQPALDACEYGQAVREGSRDRVQMSVDGIDAGRNRQVELIMVNRVTPPTKGFSIGCKDHSGDVCGRAGRPVMSGKPLGRGEHDRAGGNRNINLGVEEFAAALRTGRHRLWIGEFWPKADAGMKTSGRK
jgi:hypothetical protein